MIALGNLGFIWTDFFVASETSFKKDFAGFFGADWEQVMVGAEKPFAVHLYWDGYFSVHGIKPVNGLTLASLTGPEQAVNRFNIVAG